MTETRLLAVLQTPVRPRKTFKLAARVRFPSPALTRAFDDRGSLSDRPEVLINGVCAPGFGKVREAFAWNFIERGEIGAAVYSALGVTRD